MNPTTGATTPTTNTPSSTSAAGNNVSATVTPSNGIVSSVQGTSPTTGLSLGEGQRAAVTLEERKLYQWPFLTTVVSMESWTAGQGKTTSNSQLL